MKTTTKILVASLALVLAAGAENPATSERKSRAAGTETGAPAGAAVGTVIEVREKSTTKTSGGAGRKGGSAGHEAGPHTANEWPGDARRVSPAVQADQLTLQVKRAGSIDEEGGGAVQQTVELIIAPVKNDAAKEDQAANRAIQWLWRPEFM